MKHSAWVLAAALALGGQAVASSTRAASQPGAKLLETLTVPATADRHEGPLLKTKFDEGEKYTLVISGTVIQGSARTVDPIYCLEGPACEPRKPFTPIQLTWFRGHSGAGSTYAGWGLFGTYAGGIARMPAYNSSHVYEDTIVPNFDARIRVGVSGIAAAGNKGSFTVRVYGPAAKKVVLDGPLELTATCGKDQPTPATHLTCNRFRGLTLTATYNKQKKQFPVLENGHHCCRIDLEQSPAGFSSKPPICIVRQPGKPGRLLAENCVILEGQGATRHHVSFSGRTYPKGEMRYQAVIVGVRSVAERQQRLKKSNIVTVKWVGPNRPGPND